MSKSVDLREEMFSEPIIEENIHKEDDPHVYQRVTYFVPATKARFETIMVAVGTRSKPGQAGVEYHQSVRSYLKVPVHQRGEAARKDNHAVGRLSDQQVAELIDAERQRRHLWAKLSDHLFGVAEHDLTEIQKGLALTDEDIRSLIRFVVEPVTKLTGTVSDDDLTNARKELADFESTYSRKEIDDSRRLAHSWGELRQAIRRIQSGRQQLAEIHLKHPLLFQTPEDRGRFHPQKNKPTKANFINAHDKEPEATESDSGTIDDSGKNPAGERRAQGR